MKLRMCCALLLIFGVVLGTGLVVEAAGKGSVKVDLDVAEFWTDINGVVRMTPIGPTIGSVTFRPDGKGGMDVKVKVQDGAPDTTFVTYVVPPSRWDPDGDRQTVTLNKKGKRTYHLHVEFPDPAYWIKVVVFTSDYTVGYCTDRIYDFVE